MNRIKAHIPTPGQMAKGLQSWSPCLYKSSDRCCVFAMKLPLGLSQHTSTQECANDFRQHDASTALYDSKVFFFFLFLSKWKKISLVRNKLTNLHSPLLKK